MSRLSSKQIVIPAGNRFDFHIAGSRGRIILCDISPPPFLEKIRTYPAEGMPDFEIEVGRTDGVQYDLKLFSSSRARLLISPVQGLPPYGYMTILKAVLQVFLLEKKVILFHGTIDRTGAVLLNGSRMDWFDGLDKPSSVYGRLVIIKNAEEHSWRYADFLREDYRKSPMPALQVRRLETGAGNPTDFFLRSTWYYLFFEHFGNKTEHFLPVLTTKRLSGIINGFKANIQEINSRRR